jgi:hypothetical protein
MRRLNMFIEEYLNKSKYIIISILLSIFGLINIGLATYHYLDPVQYTDADIDKDRAITECRDKIKPYRVYVTSNNTEITIKKSLLGAGDEAFTEHYLANVILGACPYFKLESFCMGEGCQLESDAQFEMIISPNEKG